MSDSTEHRKLSAIMFTDIQGFTQKMREDEKLGMYLLTKHNETMAEAAQHHGGHVIKSMGDSYLIDFDNAVNALECAIEAQRVFLKHNILEKNTAKHVLVRISIDSGDVMVRGDDVFGNQVNLAARLQGVTPPGHICVSKAVFREVEGKVNCEFAHHGFHRLKGFDEPVEVFSVVSRPGPSEIPHAPRTLACPRCGKKNMKGSLYCKFCYESFLPDQPIQFGRVALLAKLAAIISVACGFFWMGDDFFRTLSMGSPLDFVFHKAGHAAFKAAGFESPLGGVLAQCLVPVLTSFLLFAIGWFVGGFVILLSVAENLAGIADPTIVWSRNLRTCLRSDLKELLGSDGLLSSPGSLLWWLHLLACAVAAWAIVQIIDRAIRRIFAH